jgi:hypothetical protein
MSTIARSRRQRAAVARDTAPLAPRALRLRNLCLRRLAALRGLTPPGRDDLAALPEHARLADALEWWQATARSRSGDVAHATAARRPSARARLMAKAAVAASVALLALALLPAPVG